MATAEEIRFQWLRPAVEEGDGHLRRNGGTLEWLPVLVLVLVVGRGGRFGELNGADAASQC